MDSRHRLGRGPAIGEAFAGMTVEDAGMKSVIWQISSEWTLKRELHKNPDWKLNYNRKFYQNGN